MEESAPKRRRTSLRPSGSSDAAPREDARPSSPLQTADSPLRTRPKRPSWASPTKASMARWNPQILERRKSASPPKSPSPTRPPPHRRPSVAPSDQSAPEAITTQPRPPAGAFLASVPDSTRGNSVPREGGNGEPGSSRPGSRRAGMGSGMMGAPRRSPAKPSPRPLPPPGPDGEDDYNPFIGRTLRRSPETGVRVPPPPEPQLPPSVDDPISSTPPRGIHSSSPSRNKGKNKTKTTKTGSPLKQPPARPGDNENEIVNPLPRKLFGDKGAPPSSLRNGTVLAETTNNVRKIAAFDANTEKRKERDALRDQLAKLKRDLEVTARQNDRIRAMQKSGRTVPLADESEIMEIIRRQLLPQHWDSQPTQTQMLAKAALDPMAIVPFGKPAASAVPTDADEEEIADIKSHNPIPMTAEEELPFLQLFAPFSASSSLTVLPRIGEEPLLQLFTIQLRSRNSPGLFGAKLEVTVESTKLSIVSLKIAALEPAAKPELGAFLERICTGDCNRSMQRNVGIVSWAMAEWLRVAEQRARFWSQLHRDTASKELLLETSKHARTRKGKRAKDGQEKETQEAKEGPIKSQELLRFMGEQSFDLRVPSIHGSTPPSSLRLSWKIEFDWSGEAQSKVAVMVGVPGKWHQTDRKGALGKLPSLFQNLVEAGEEPKVAVRKVVALLVGEE